MSDGVTEHEGTCHCGAIGFVYRTALEPHEWPVRACQCTFCRRHGGLSTSDPRGSLRFFEHAQGALNRYRFGRKTTDFLICGRCGAYIGATMESDGKRFGIINVRALQSVLDRLPDPQPMHYENEAAGERVARREARWTPISLP